MSKSINLEAAELRTSVLEGYDDVLHGRTLALGGDLRSMIAEAKRRDAHGWKIEAHTSDEERN